VREATTSKSALLTGVQPGTVYLRSLLWYERSLFNGAFVKALGYLLEIFTHAVSDFLACG
jgi:hypothetical protein